MTRPDPAGAFHAGTPFVDERPRLLAVSCSDGRFTAAVEELAAARGHALVDTLTLPGGPALFAPTVSYSDRDAIARATGFLARMHGLRTVLLIAHQGCGWYAHHHARLAAPERERLQHADLERAAREVRRLDAGLGVEAWFARVEAGRVRFDRVPVG